MMNKKIFILLLLFSTSIGAFAQDIFSAA
ncbi:MAG: hypothetical protein JWR05_1795, partial [Mucilaginibacter sp.]|nr:hypothetical protein [Mucilaginibacter sp.]